MIVRAHAVLPMDGSAIENGVVRVNGDRIVEVGPAGAIDHPLSGPVIDLRDCALIPGLLNAHCHLDYTRLRGKIPRPKSFAQWIRAINEEKAKLTTPDYLRSIADGLRQASAFGTTSIVNLEAFPELIPKFQSSALRVWWCAELIDVNSPKNGRQIVEDAVRKSGKALSGLAPHALFTASADLFHYCRAVAEQHDYLLTTHLAESGEEMQMFREARGPLLEFLEPFGRETSDCRGRTPTELFLDVGEVPSHASGRHDAAKKAMRTRTPGGEIADTRPVGWSRWIVAHLNELSEMDFARLESIPEKFSVAHCPRSHAYFGHAPFQFRRLRQLGFNICLGTDSLASNEDLSLFAEMRQFRKSYPEVSAEEVLATVTINVAKAIGASDRLGRIRAGYLADMIALPLSGSARFCDTIIDFTGKVPWMMVGGEVLPVT